MKKMSINKKITINKKFKIILVALLFVIVITAVVLIAMHGLKDEEQNLSSYRMELSYNNTSHSLSGKEEVTFVNNYENMFTYLLFHLYPNAFREDAINRVVSQAEQDHAYPNGESYGNITINSVTYNDEPLKFSIEGEDENILRVELPVEVYPDESITVTIDFDVTLANINHRLGYGNNTINLGNFYPVLCVYEDGTGFKTDLYHSNGDPFYSNTANYDVTLTYPSSLTMASSGKVISLAYSSEQVEPSTTTNHIKGKNIRDFAIVLSEIFEVESQKVGDTTVNYYGYQGDKNLNSCLKTSVEALETFSDLFGDYPYSTLNVVKTNFVHGGMEYPNLVYISDDVPEEDLAYVIVHEIAHQWWYGVVGNDEYNHAWMDEGLAEYSTLMFFEEHSSYGLDAKQMVTNATTSYKTFVRVYTSVNGEVDTSMERNLSQFATEPEYVQCTYTKGLIMFDTIRKSVGDKKFTKALQNYYEDFAYKNASPADMIASFSKTTHSDLEGFFLSWLTGEVVIQ